MAKPPVITCTAGHWTLVAASTLQIALHVKESRPFYYFLATTAGTSAPTGAPVSEERSALSFFPPERAVATFPTARDVYVYAHSDSTPAIDGLVVAYL